MPQLSLMNKAVLYGKPGDVLVGEKDKTVIEIPKSYNTWSPSVNGLDSSKNVFSGEDDQKQLLSDFHNYCRRNSVNLQWKDITYKTLEGTKILSGLNGFARGGELTAIMGPSGAGKTSLLNVLSGFTQTGVTGQIYLNGRKRDMLTFRKLSGYILQDDHVLERFTVRELITYASKLKLPKSISDKEKQKMVDDCIYSLGLISQQHQRANTLSGGQRKRLCIGEEIVSNPPIIFLDEPTRFFKFIRECLLSDVKPNVFTKVMLSSFKDFGLDSSNCVQIMQLLKSFAQEGRNVICTIHQPSSRIYEILDNLYMMSDGQCIYQGSTKNLLPFMANQGLDCPKYHSPTDFIMDVAIGLYGNLNWKLKCAVDAMTDDKSNWHEIDSLYSSKKDESSCAESCMSMFKWNVKVQAKRHWLDDSRQKYATNFWNQFTVLIHRSYLIVIREPVNLKLKFIGSLVIGFLLGSLYYQTGNEGSLIFNNTGLLFTLLVFLIVTAKVPVILTFPLQRAVFEREHLNCWYDIKSYYLARTIAEIPFQILFPVITSSLVYWLSGQPPEMDRFSLFLVTMVMVCLCAESIGLVIGAAASVKNGIYITGAITCPAIVLSGSILSIKDVPVYLRWLCHLTYTRYGFQGIMMSLYENRAPMACNSNFCFFTDPMQFVRYKDMEGDIATDFWALFGFFMFFRVLAYFVLRHQITKNR